MKAGLVLASVRVTYVVLACAHLDHDPGNSASSNLKALCQRCHMIHDAAEHRWQRWWNVFRLRAIRDLYEELRKIVASSQADGAARLSRSPSGDLGQIHSTRTVSF